MRLSGIEAGKLERHLKGLRAQVRTELSLFLMMAPSNDWAQGPEELTDVLEKPSGRREAEGKLTCRVSAPTRRRHRKVAPGTAARPRRVSDEAVNTATSTPGAGATRLGLSPQLHFPEWARSAASRPHPSHRPGGSQSPGPPSRPRGGCPTAAGGGQSLAGRQAGRSPRRRVQSHRAHGSSAAAAGPRRDLHADGPPSAREAATSLPRAPGG